MPILPFKLNQDRRHHFPRQQRKVTNPLGALLRSWPAHDASLRQRSSLTIWFTDEAITAWAAAASLGIELAPLPGYSLDLMPVAALVARGRHPSPLPRRNERPDPTRRVAAFEAQVNQDPCAVADRLWVKDHLDPDREKLRFSS